MAVCAGHAEIVKLLLDQGADPGQSRYTYNSWDKLLLCARERGYRQIESLLQRAMRKRFNYTPDFDVLKEAIIARDSRKIGAVLRRQPNLARASDALGNNALHWSVITRQLGLIERFVELGTPIDAQRADGQTPVLLAVNGAMDYWYRATRGRSHPSLRNTSVMVGSLLAQGANYTISVAAAVGDQERVEQLLRKDAGLARRLDSARVSPLSYAAREGHLHIVRLLLEHGADPNMPEDCGSRRPGAVRGLLRQSPGGRRVAAGARRQSERRHGFEWVLSHDWRGLPRRPGEAAATTLAAARGLHAAVLHMSVQEMKQAIRDGHEVIRHEEFLGNVMAKRDAELLDLYLDSDPTVPNAWIVWSGVTYPRSPGLVRRLLARGLDPNRPDWLGKTFLHACAENGDRSVAAIFLDAGADINARDVEFQGTPLAAAVRSSWVRSRRSAKQAEAQATDGRVPAEARRRDQPARRRTVGHAAGLGTKARPCGYRRDAPFSWGQMMFQC